MFNHSSRDQNVGWERDIRRGVVVYKTLRDIQVGEELCQFLFSILLHKEVWLNRRAGISYGDRLWFKDTDAASSEDEDKEDYLGNIQIDS